MWVIPKPPEPQREANFPEGAYQVTVPEGGGEYRLHIDKHLVDLDYRENEHVIDITIKKPVLRKFTGKEEEPTRLS